MAQGRDRADLGGISRRTFTVDQLSFVERCLRRLAEVLHENFAESSHRERAEIAPRSHGVRTRVHVARVDGAGSLNRVDARCDSLWHGAREEKVAAATHAARAAEWREAGGREGPGGGEERSAGVPTHDAERGMKA